jgi:cytochrome c biogenesis protein
VLAQPGSYQLWVENVAVPKFGFWANVLSALRFFDIFHSPWFLTAGGLLIINILCCTANRWRSIATPVRSKSIKQSTSFYRSGTETVESKITGLPGDAKLLALEILKKRHYRVRAGQTGNRVEITADKNRFSPLGTLLVHLSLVLFVIGFLLGGFLGFRDTGFIVSEGSTREVGHGTGLSLELRSFEDEYWPDGVPKDYRSDVVLFSESHEVAQGLIRVNSPLRYRGVNFYQSGFGPAVKISVRAAGETIYDGSVPLIWSIENGGLLRYTGQFQLPSGTTIQLISAAFNGPDTLIGEDQIAVEVFSQTANEPETALLDTGVPHELGGMQFTFGGQEQFSIFQVSRNPGINLVWVACASLVIGLGMVFYFPYRRLWVLLEPAKNDSSLLTVRSSGRSSPGTGEINHLIGEMNRS